MELKEEFQEAKAWVEENFHLNVVSQSSWGVRARSSWRGHGPTLSSLRPRGVEALAPGCQQSSPAMTLPSPPWAPGTVLTLRKTLLGLHLPQQQ